MNGTLRVSWQYIVNDLWIPLSVREDSPSDLFNDLFAEADAHFRYRTEPQTLDEIRNDETRAAKSFLGIKGTDFVSEYRIVRFLEEAHQIIVDYTEPAFEREFNRLLRECFVKYNLRYRLEDPFAIRILFPGTFANLYAELHRISAPNPHLGSLLTDFEIAFDTYSRAQNDTNLKTCISKASNYAEGLASATHGTPGTLGSLCDKLTDWPHDEMKESLKKLYKFCCDYPGIRHGGTAANQKRPLGTRDLTLACLLLLVFSGHLSPTINEITVLGAQ